MHISVVIPVYNATRFLTEAVESALAQQEIKEILLIDDGSKDNSLDLCQELAGRYPDRIQVLRHTDRANHGAAASRNVGLQNAQNDFIAFLDADDVYVTGRFKETEKIFNQYRDADAVYETVMTTRFDGKDLGIDTRAGKIQAGLSRQISPKELFHTLAIAQEGYIHLDGLVIRKTSLSADLYFDPSLRQCEDTDFLLRWAAGRTLYGGDPDHAVALRRIHDTNIVFNTSESLRSRYLCMRKCALHHFYGSEDHTANREILNRMARATKLVSFVRRQHMPVTPFRLGLIATFLLQHPRVMKEVI